MDVSIEPLNDYMLILPLVMYLEPGHMSSGRVIAAGPAVKHVTVGQLVFFPAAHVFYVKSKEEDEELVFAREETIAAAFLDPIDLDDHDRAKVAEKDEDAVAPLAKLHAAIQKLEAELSESMKILGHLNN